MPKADTITTMTLTTKENQGIIRNLMIESLEMETNTMMIPIKSKVGNTKIKTITIIIMIVKGSKMIIRGTMDIEIEMVAVGKTIIIIKIITNKKR